MTISFILAEKAGIEKNFKYKSLNNQFSLI